MAINEAPFFRTPSPRLLEAVEAIPEETLECLWAARFPEPPNVISVIFDEFYYAVSYKWWNSGKMTRVELRTPGASAFKVRFEFL